MGVTNLGACHPRGCRTPVGYEVRDAGGPRPIDLLNLSLCFNGGQHEEEMNTEAGRATFTRNYRQTRQVKLK